MLRLHGSEHGIRERSSCVTPGRGFTIIELLITVGVVILLLSILLVALGQAMKGSQTANTRFLLTSIEQGLVRFKEDIGYYPPILTASRRLDLFDESWFNGLDTYRDQVPQWGSRTSLPEYLLGYGHHYEDGFGIVPDATDAARDWEMETPPLGIRNPGRDGVWGALFNGQQNGAINSRMRVGLNNVPTTQGSELVKFDIDQGRVFGPYIELKDEDLLASIDDEGVIRHPGDPGFDITASNQSAMIVDFWGEPIWYHRRPYPPGGLRQGYRRPRNLAGAGEHMPTLSDTFYLRPYNIADGGAIDGLEDFSNNVSGSGDTSTSYDVNAAEFGLISAGPDRTMIRHMRADPDEFNRDNVVEVGP